MQQYIDEGEQQKAYERPRQKKTSLFYRQALEETEEFIHFYEKDVKKLQILENQIEGLIDHIEERNTRFYHRLERIFKNEQNLIQYSKGFEKFGLFWEGNTVIYKEWAPEAQSLTIYGEFNEWEKTTHLALQVEEVWEVAIDNVQKGSKFLVDVDNISKIPPYIKSISIVNQKIFGTFETLQYDFKYPKQNRDVRKIIQIEYSENMTLQQLQEYDCVVLKGAISHKNNQVIGYFASNGNPILLKQFIDYLHSQNISVIIDFPLQLSLDSPIIQFDRSDYHYFTKGTHKVHLDFDKWELNRYLLSALHFWLIEYQIDGFSFSDLEKIIQMQQIANQTQEELLRHNCNIDALIFLMLANNVVHFVDKGALTFAQDFPVNYPGQGSIKIGGLGFDAINIKFDKF